MRIVIALAVALMAANHASLVQAGERPDLAVRLHDYVMERVDSYGQLNEPKVMAVCVDWNASNESGIYVHNVFIHYTGITSDRPIFAGELARAAKDRCKKWAKSEAIDCTCTMLDSNSKNVLKVPTAK